jgi:hypothetical protein
VLVHDCPLVQEFKFLAAEKISAQLPTLDQIPNESPARVVQPINIKDPVLNIDGGNPREQMRYGLTLNNVNGKKAYIVKFYLLQQLPMFLDLFRVKFFGGIANRIIPEPLSS